MAKQVRDVMHEGVVTCDHHTTLRDALRLMGANTIRSIVVTDAYCALTGIISQTDLVNASISYPDKWSEMRVDEVMSRNVLTVTVDAPVSQAAKMLVENHVHRIIVVDGENPCEPVGVLAMSDLVKDLMEA
jgi:acetoin utilization protein AcuB